MLNGYRFRLYPNPAQEQILLRWIGCQRLIYNAKVQEDRDFRRFARRMVGTAGMAIPVDQQDSQFITERTAFLREVPSQVLRNGAVKFRQAYQRVFQKLGGRPKPKKKSGRHSVWLTSELFEFIPVREAVSGYALHIGTEKFPVGVIPYVAHRSHAVPASIHLAVEGGHCDAKKGRRTRKKRIATSCAISKTKKMSVRTMPIRPVTVSSPMRPMISMSSRISRFRT